MTLSKRKFSLKTQIARQFVLFSLFISFLFSGVAFLALYEVEDAYFELILQEEAEHLTEKYNTSGKWQQPKAKHMQLYFSVAEFPNDIRALALEEPNRVEFSGDQDRYYHVYAINKNQGPFLVAQVSEQLLVRPRRESIFWMLGSVSVFMAIGGIILGYRLSKRAINPLTQLAEQVEETSPKNLLDPLAPNYPKNEIGQLAEALDDSRQRIAKFVEREQNFTRDASHELRTPVAIIQSSAELALTDKAIANSKVEPVINRILTACKQVEQTISTLLALAREDQITTNQTIFVLPLVEQVIIQQAHLLKDKDIDVNVDIPTNYQWPIEQNFLHILLTNLIGNAFQYTQQGKVSVFCKEKALVIQDTGEGFSNELKETAMHPLVKGDNSQGFGIGLSLVSRLCEHLNINLMIQHLGHGTRFTLELQAKNSN